MNNLSLAASGGNSHCFQYVSLLRELETKNIFLKSISCNSGANMFITPYAIGKKTNDVQDFIIELPQKLMMLEKRIEKNLFNPINLIRFLYLKNKMRNLWPEIMETFRDFYGIRWNLKNCENLFIAATSRKNFSKGFGSKKIFSDADVLSVMTKKNDIIYSAYNYQVYFFSKDGIYKWSMMNGITKFSDTVIPLYRAVLASISNTFLPTITDQIEINNGDNRKHNVKISWYDGGPVNNHANLIFSINSPLEDRDFIQVSPFPAPSITDDLPGMLYNLFPSSHYYKIPDYYMIYKKAFFEFTREMSAAYFNKNIPGTNIFTK